MNRSSAGGGEEAQMLGTYLYAIMAGDHSLELGRLGLPDGKTLVNTLQVHGLTAVVGDYSGPPVQELPRAELLRSLAIHQLVIERVMASHPVLPTRFGTVLPSQMEVRGVLGHRRDVLMATLQELGDAVEVEVAATWNLHQVCREIGRRPEIVALAASATGRPPGEVRETQIEVGKLVKAALDRRREGLRELVVSQLAPLARDIQPNALTVDELVLNVAFLVDRPQLDAFHRQITRLDEEIEDGLTFRCIGPLPPYSFASVEIARYRPEEIDAARQLLELGERVTKSDVTASYRRLAIRCHPDRNPQDPTAAERFAVLARAHARLLTYLQGQRGAADEADDYEYDLVRPAAESMLVLTIKRSEPDPVQAVKGSVVRDVVAV